MTTLWAVLLESGKLAGPFAEPLLAKDWFNRLTSLTEGRYLVLPMAVPQDPDDPVESDSTFLLRLAGSLTSGWTPTVADLTRLGVLGARARAKEGEQTCPTCCGHGVVGQRTS